nr:hypothetical protein Itr_chr02CG13440 [Ipomoea trifida]
MILYPRSPPVHGILLRGKTMTLGWFTGKSDNEVQSRDLKVEVCYDFHYFCVLVAIAKGKSYRGIGFRRPEIAYRFRTRHGGEGFTLRGWVCIRRMKLGFAILKYCL